MNREELHKRHSRNHEEIDTAFENILSNLLYSIRTQNASQAKTNTRLLIFLLGTYIETFLNQFLYELHYETQNPYFDEVTIHHILSLKREEYKWEYVIRYAFEKNFSQSKANFSRTQHIVYNDIIESFSNYIEPIIRLRNKIAHGQWVYIISGEDEEIYDGKKVKQVLNTENYLSLRHRKKILIKFKDLIIKLVSTQNILDNYDDFYQNIENISREIDNIDFDRWKQQQVDAYQRGQIYKKENQK